uniref:F-box domain-containing protein n=2 Tax=Strongyloides stercoralis TaxID=6248 RepID=A0A0K0DV15_STRER
MNKHDLMIFCFTEPGISKNIFNYISSYEDTINLSSSCKFFKTLLNLTPKNMVSHNENCFYEISLDRNIKTNENFAICYNPFSRTKRSSYLFDDEITYLSTLPNNYFTFQTEITTEIDLNFDNISIDSANIIIDNLGSFINRLSLLFKNAKILNLSLSYPTYNYLGRLLLKIKSDKIETIKFSVQDLFQKIPQDSLLGNKKLFDGLPNFKEIYVSGFLSSAYHYGFNAHNSVLTHFIKCLSNRSNCLFNISELNYSSIHQEVIAEYMELVSNNGFSIKYKDEFDFPSTIYVPLREREFFAKSNILDSLSSISIKIRTHQLFFPIVKSIEKLTKLKEIHVTMLNININNVSNVSWEGITNLQLFNLDFCLTEEVHPIIAKNADYSYQLNVIKFFASILPCNVKKLRLHNIYCMTDDVSNFINKSLPNIQFLWIQCGIFQKETCLDNFKNIKYLILLNVHDIKIPKSVEIFIMEQKWVIRTLDDVEKIFKKYSESFPYCILQKPSLCRVYFKNLHESKQLFDIVKYYHTNNPPSLFTKIPRF